LSEPQVAPNGHWDRGLPRPGREGPRGRQGWGVRKYATRSPEHLRRV